MCFWPLGSGPAHPAGPARPYLQKPEAPQTGPGGRAGAPGSGSRASAPLPLSPGHGLCSLPPGGPPLRTTQGTRPITPALLSCPPSPCTACPYLSRKLLGFLRPGAGHPTLGRCPRAAGLWEDKEPVGTTSPPTPLDGCRALGVRLTVEVNEADTALHHQGHGLA